MPTMADHDAYIAAAPEPFRPSLKLLRERLARIRPTRPCPKPPPWIAYPSMRWLLLLLLCCACASGLPRVPTPSPDEGGRRQQELDWLVSALERRHPHLHSVTPSPRFEAEVAELRARLPSATPQATFVGLLRVLALVGDSHTRLEDYAPVEERVSPVVYGAWPDGWWVIGVQPERADLFACRLLSIDGRPVEECAKVLAPMVAHENEIVLRRGVARLLALPQVLAEVGLANDPARVTLTLRDSRGVEREQVVESIAGVDLKGWTAFAPSDWRNPLYLTRRYENWWWTDLAEARTLYFQFNRCAQTPEKPFAVCAAELLERLDRGDLLRLVIDLRHNGGGDSGVLQPLLDGLSKRSRWRGAERLVVLIGNGTYSSAVLNAMALRRDLGALLVGEPCGQKPNSFGEIRTFHLPFSGLEVACSTRRFRVVDGDPPTFDPDVLVPTAFDDVYRGRDPVLEWVLARPW